MMSSRNKLAVKDAETLAIRALSFLAEDDARIGRFLSLTGLTPDTLKSGADQRDLFRAVLEHLLGDESLLLTFSANASVDPAAVQQAHRLLDAGQGDL